MVAAVTIFDVVFFAAGFAVAWIFKDKILAMFNKVKSVL